jgi:hypothetical protein
MKVSLTHLELAISSIRRNYAQREGEDMEVDITIKEGDPGNGTITDVLRLYVDSATEFTMQRSSNISDQGSIEVYPKDDKQLPVFEWKASKKLGPR